MRVVAITSLFPNAAEPLSAPFNRQQFSALGGLCEVEVWGTIPWFPGKGLIRRRRPEDVSIPAEEGIDGLRVLHPRTPYVPGVGHAASVPLYVAALARSLWRRRHEVDVILGSWAYPDGAAVIALGQMLGLPVVVKLHGSDLNVVAKRRLPRAQLERLLPRAEAVVAVSRPLASRAEALGVPRDRLHVVTNGIDRRRFRPRDRKLARAQLELAERERWVLYCGHLKRSKGIEDLMEAFAKLCRARSDVRLVVVGDGPDRRVCERAAAALGNRVRLAGAQPHESIPTWIAACDVLVLPSWHEGTPNVVLEALSCGRRVVATDVGGTVDLLRSPALGELVAPHSPVELAAALSRAVDKPYDPEAIARESAAVDWTESAAALLKVLTAAARPKGSAAPETRAAPSAAGQRARSHG
jgi:teichuronic acid biosynthesis glycosyltransferase TuaC